MASGVNTVDWYADWVHGQVNVDPSVQTRQWSREWKRLHDALSPPEVNGIFEFASIVIARWESLGGLYLGNADTNVADAREYMRKFLAPANPAYLAVENLVPNPTPNRLDFFTMLRHNPLHGLNPAAVATQDARHVVTWLIGFSGIEAQQHLHVDEAGRLQVDCSRLFAELQQSMEAYAQYLDLDTDEIGGVRPKERWRRAYWDGFKPKFMPQLKWRQKGADRGFQL